MDGGILSRQDVRRLKLSKADLRNAQAAVANLIRSNRYLQDFLISQREIATGPSQRQKIEDVLAHAAALAAGKPSADVAAHDDIQVQPKRGHEHRGPRETAGRPPARAIDAVPRSGSSNNAADRGTDPRAQDGHRGDTGEDTHGPDHAGGPRPGP